MKISLFYYDYMTGKSLSLDEIKKFPSSFFERLLKKMKNELKNDPIMNKIFKEYNVDIGELEFYPMWFKDLDVSAKTDHGVIYFNYELLCDGDFNKDYSYAIHEVTHVLQQTTGNKPTQSSDEGSYLKNPFEQEGFANQIEYISKEFGDDEADKYVEHLLDHHDIDNKSERKDLKEELTVGVE